MPSPAQMKAFGIAKREAYRAKYRALGWTILSRRYNEPTKSTWRTLSRRIHNNKWRWSDGQVFDFSSFADHHY